MEPPSNGPSLEPHTNNVSVYPVKGDFKNLVTPTTFAPAFFAILAT